MRIKEKQNDNIITDRNIRDKCVGHYEVLERVKKLLLLPGTELMSIEQVQIIMKFLLTTSNRYMV